MRLAENTERKKVAKNRHLVGIRTTTEMEISPSRWSVGLRKFLRGRYLFTALSSGVF